MKHFVPMAKHSFPVPAHLVSICNWFSARKTLNGPQTKANIFICLLDHGYEAPFPYENGTPRVARNAFNIGKVWNPVCCHGNKTVKLKLWSTFNRIVLQRIKHFWYKLAEISFFIIFDQIWLSVWRHQLANLHILKTWISLEQKEISENNKKHFYSHAGYLFML